MSSRTETYMLLRCCLYGQAGYFQPVIWQCSLEHNGNVHYDKTVHSKMGQCRLIMAAKPNLSFCKSRNWNSKPWFLGGLVPHRSALIQKVWATSPRYPLWPLQIAAVPAWLRNGDCLATTTETLLSNLKPKTLSRLSMQYCCAGMEISLLNQHFLHRNPNLQSPPQASAEIPQLENNYQSSHNPPGTGRYKSWSNLLHRSKNNKLYLHCNGFANNFCNWAFQGKTKIRSTFSAV